MRFYDVTSWSYVNLDDPILRLYAWTFVIFECAHLKFPVSGRSMSTHTCVRNAVTLVWGSLGAADTNLCCLQTSMDCLFRAVFHRHTTMTSLAFTEFTNKVAMYDKNATI